MSDSDSESSPEPSPPQSPEASFHHGPPNLERLVLHFVDAKRSLTATSHVYRANELVTTSRHLIEETAILYAKNDYASRGLDEQLETLNTIRDALLEDVIKVSNEFNVTIADIDSAHARLEKTLTLLRETVVNGSTSERDSEADDESKTLYDFIDDTTHENLMSTLRSLIDQFNSARVDLTTNHSELDTSLKLITETLADASNEDHDETNKPTIYDEPPPSIPQLFRSMEEHATEMAGLLSNLVNHYDLSVTALKHTEGGGEAAKAAVQQAVELSENAAAEPEESLYRKTVAEPISDVERSEMLGVLEKDALEVDDVVTEIRDRAGEMEESFSHLNKYVKIARLRNKTLRKVLTLMHEIRAAIPRHMHVASTFRETWSDIRLHMQSKTEELAGLSVFYEEFLAGYDKLLMEVERRKNSESVMKRIADKARKELNKLHEADRRAREAFMEEVGAYLPSDLGAWHALDEDGVKWEVRPLYNGDEEERGASLPRLLDG